MTPLILSTCTSPSILAPPLPRLNHKPLCSNKRFCTTTRSNSRTPDYPYFAINRSYQNTPSTSIRDEEDSMVAMEDQASCDDLRAELMPKHVALFFDGHRRWAKERQLPIEVGYGASYRPLKDIVWFCCELGIKVFSIFVFSSETFRRPKEEVDFAINMIESAMRTDFEELARNDIRLSIIGNRNSVPKGLLEIITETEETTKNNKGLHIIGAHDYTGRSDILQACVTLARKVKDDEIQPLDIDESLFQQHLQTNCSEFPNPDLVIRTGGKLRLSNFMLWQMAYSELYFIEKYAPEFTRADFIQALIAYQKRHRRFGKYKY